MEPFKNLMSPARVAELGAQISRVHATFPEDAFVADASRLEALELKARVEHVAQALRRHLPGDVPRALQILVATLPPPFDPNVPNGADFLIWPLTRYVSLAALDHPDAALDALHALTQRFSAEFDIRPFLLRHQELTLTRLRRWVTDPSVHVRRLVSEGTRTRLPWGERLRPFIDDPTPVWPLLEALRADQELYVRRSVANNLNDLTKDHPAHVVDRCRRWLAEVPGVDMERLVRHALRGLVKAGDPDALALLGAHVGAEVEVGPVGVARQAEIGDSVEVTVTLRNPGETPIVAVVDYRVTFAGPRGPRQPKVFKWGRYTLAPGETRPIAKTHAFRDVSIRTHHPGDHPVEVMVNGEVKGAATVTLTRR